MAKLNGKYSPTEFRVMATQETKLEKNMLSILTHVYSEPGTNAQLPHAPIPYPNP